MKCLALVALLFVAGCSSTVPKLQQYLLRADVPSQYSVTDSTAVTGIGLVTVASYINGLGLVLETSDGEVRTARDHQWAEPLRESLRIFLAREISGETGQIIRAQLRDKNNWQRRIDIRVDELHGTAGGEARLVAYWSVFDYTEHTIISENGFFEVKALTSDGYGALVQAEKELLRSLAAAIASAL